MRRLCRSRGYGQDVESPAGVTVRIEADRDAGNVILTFLDSGKPFDPLAAPDPDTTLKARERRIGGLGIFMVKKTMDDVFYAYRDGQNVLTMRKNIREM